MRRTIEKSVLQTEEHPISITASFGISDYIVKTDKKPPEKVLSEFIASADQALYASKDSGRNRLTIFSPGQTSLK